MHLLNRDNAIAFALFATFLVAHAEGRFLPQFHFFGEEYHCPGLKEGKWNIKKYYPAIGFPPESVHPDPKPTDFVLPAIFDVELQKVAENVYNGTGIAETFIPHRRTDPVVVSGLFDPKTCVFSGALSNADGDGSIIFRWYSEGDKMSGPIIVTIDKILTKPLVGFVNATQTE